MCAKAGTGWASSAQAVGQRLQLLRRHQLEGLGATLPPAPHLDADSSGGSSGSDFQSPILPPSKPILATKGARCTDTRCAI